MSQDFSFNIERWGSVMNASSINPRPIVYFKPDLDVLNFFQANNNFVRVVITGTNTSYDNTAFNGVVDSSADIPACRPNFFDKTGWYVVTLDSDWNGDNVDNNGKIMFIGYTPNNVIIQNMLRDGDSNKHKYNWFIITVLVLSILLFIYVMSRLVKENYNLVAYTRFNRINFQ